MDTYTIVRHYAASDLESDIVATGLTLNQAQDHCHDPETSSTTATSPEAVARTAAVGNWFDGYTAE